MTTKNLYIGWDVGAWHRKPIKGKSCDAICLIQEIKTNQVNGPIYKIIGHARENLSDSIQKLFLNDDLENSLEGLLKFWVKLCLAEQNINPEELEGKIKEILDVSTITIAIDAPLGWSIHFQNLLKTKRNAWNGGNIYRGKEIESPILFRKTERNISNDGHDPKSAVTHMIGSQSTKGLAFVRSRCFKNGFCRWKSSYRDTIVIETYPKACYSSKSFWRYVNNLNLDQQYKTDTSEDDSFDAVVCACLALIYRKKEFENIQINYPTFSHRNFKSEGWIFVPKRQKEDYQTEDTNKCVDSNSSHNQTFQDSVGMFLKRCEEKRKQRDKKREQRDKKREQRMAGN